MSEKLMKQLSLAETGFLPKRGKVTRKAEFLAEMNVVVPWSRLDGLIEPVYPKAGRGRRPTPLSVMLRIHFMQHWFGYSDPAMEEALHDIPLLRQFAGLDAFEDTIPDETTILKFRRLLEKHQLTAAIMNAINNTLEQQGLLLKGGTMVDATIIHAAPSTQPAALCLSTALASTMARRHSADSARIRSPTAKRKGLGRLLCIG